MKRRELITLLGGAAGAWTLGAHAQQSERIRRIGVLIGLAEMDLESQMRIAAIRDELQKKGWTEGRNLRINFRWTPGDASLMRAFAKELVELQPDVIIGHASAAIGALLKETATRALEFIYRRERTDSPRVLYESRCSLLVSFYSVSPELLVYDR